MRLRQNAKAVHDPVCVVKITDYLNGIENILIVKPGFAQAVYVRFSHLFWRESQLSGKIEKRSGLGAEVYLCIVFLNF